MLSMNLTDWSGCKGIFGRIGIFRLRNRGRVTVVLEQKKGK